MMMPVMMRGKPGQSDPGQFNLHFSGIAESSDVVSAAPTAQVAVVMSRRFHKKILTRHVPIVRGG